MEHQSGGRYIQHYNSWTVVTASSKKKKKNRGNGHHAPYVGVGIGEV